MTTDEFLSTVYHALRATRRRQVIQLVIESDEPIFSVRDLARRITAQEEDVPTERATGEPYRNTYNALSQTHLPTLDAVEIVIYDSDRQTVSAGPNIAIAALLDSMIRPAIHVLHSTDCGNIRPEVRNDRLRK